jgi:tetratricopeptide (TPR) repeat protein
VNDREATVTDDTPPGSFESALQGLLAASARWLLRDATPGPYLDWMARDGPALGAGMLPADARGPGHEVESARLMRLFGHVIYATLPLPQQGFEPGRIGLPGPAEPCVCGSLRRFRHCCEATLDSLPRLPAEMAMPHVLDAMGRSAWAALPPRAPVRLVEAAAEAFRQQHRFKDSVALLEPWAAQQGCYPEAWAALLDLLADLYADLNKPRKRRALAQAMIDRGEPAVQSKGWQRLCLMATDAGRRSRAAEAYTRAQRLAPDDPALSLLELSMLLGFGEARQASQRAQFHVRRLGRMNTDGRFDDLIDGLREMGERGHGFLEDVSLAHEPELARLDTWAGTLGAPQLRIDLARCSPDDLGELTPAAPLAGLLDLWRSSFDLQAPALVSLQTARGDPWPGFAQWMALLEEQPTLGDSFEVLDALLMALQAHPSPGALAASRRLRARALALWEQLRQRFPRAACRWAVWPNRPALRVLAQHIAADATPMAEHSFEWLRHLVEVVNPNDNHGFRTRLAAVFLRRGMFSEALALSDRYPDDLDQMMLARVLALWHGSQRGAATALLADTLRSNPKLAKVMRSARLPQPRQDEFITVGSLQEAQLAYAEQWDLWQDAELREMLMAVSRRQGSA